MIRIRLAAACIAASVVAALACSTSLPSALQVRLLSILLGSTTLVVGQTATVAIEMRDGAGNPVSTGDVVWSSSNPAVATVNAAQITALSAGATQIAATSEGASAQATLTVTPAPAVAVAAVSVSIAASTVPVGQSTQATATTRDANGAVLTGRALAWTSNNDAIATVSASGLVTTVATGSAAITATSEGRSGSASITVTPPPAIPVATVSVVLNSSTLTTGQSTQATATTRDASGAVLAGRVIAWSSGNTAVATVSTSGLVTAVGAGSAQITATSEGQSGGVPLQVNAAPTASPATQLTLTTAPPSAATSGVALTPQPAVQLRDAGGVAVAQAGVAVQAAIASGGGTLSGSTSATTTGSGVATFTGLTITGTDGPRTLRFTAPAASPAVTGVTSGAITVTTPPPPPPPAPGEPTYSSTTGTMVYQDNMESYSTATAMGSTALSGARIVPVPSPYTNSIPVETNHNEVISTGRTGKALRMIYTGEYQWGSDFATVLTTPQADTATHYFQYWARVTFAAPLTSPLSVKWFMAWHRQLDRIQWNTHWPARAHTQATRSTIWQVYDQGRETSGQGDQPVGPYFDQVTDAQWHRYTYAYRVNSAPGRRDGFARMWVDGVKMIDISAATIDVTPPGGTKPWCLAEDVDALAVNEGIAAIRWGAPQTTTSPAWTYDVDDVLWWVKK